MHLPPGVNTGFSINFSHVNNSYNFHGRRTACTFRAKVVSILLFCFAIKSSKSLPGALAFNFNVSASGALVYLEVICYVFTQHDFRH